LDHATRLPWIAAWRSIGAVRLPMKIALKTLAEAAFVVTALKARRTPQEVPND
jgi:hypothetical protein